MTAQQLVFVYGSLKRGFRHAGLIRAGCVLGQATATPFALVRYGEYPAMTPAADGVVYGELTLLDAAQLLALDAFEDCPTLYQRTQIGLTDGRVAFAYTIPREVAQNYARLADGVWREEPRLSARDGSVAGTRRD